MKQFQPVLEFLLVTFVRIDIDPKGLFSFSLLAFGMSVFCAAKA
jgi:hypothetical protein